MLSEALEELDLDVFQGFLALIQQLDFTLLALLGLRALRRGAMPELKSLVEAQQLRVDAREPDVHLLPRDLRHERAVADSNARQQSFVKQTRVAAVDEEDDLRGGMDAHILVRFADLEGRGLCGRVVEERMDPVQHRLRVQNVDPASTLHGRTQLQHCRQQKATLRLTLVADGVESHWTDEFGWFRSLVALCSVTALVVCLPHTRRAIVEKSPQCINLARVIVEQQDRTPRPAFQVVCQRLVQVRALDFLAPPESFPKMPPQLLGLLCRDELQVRCKSSRLS
mmetsp:Transcript_64086/g.150815  ORF Transcript_64086/g.150815 Transcript_64086/m.150815 type:complete len:282 (-) Transcript_64086:259-1104(-)